MRFLSALFLSLLCVPAAFAHTDGFSFERQSGDILIDIGYGKQMPMPGSTLTYSFDLFNVKNANSYAFEPFTKVHVRILKGKEELIDKDVMNDGVNVPSLTYTYADKGEYSMDVSYERTGKESVDAVFGFRVGPPDSGNILVLSPLVAGIGAAVVLLVAARAFLFFRKKNVS